MKLRYRIAFSILAAMLVSLGIALTAHLMSLDGWAEATGRVTRISYGDGADKCWFDFEYEIDGARYETKIYDDMDLYFRDMPLPRLGETEFHYDTSSPSNIRFDGKFKSTMLVCGMGFVICGVVFTAMDFLLRQ